MKELPFQRTYQLPPDTVGVNCFTDMHLNITGMDLSYKCFHGCILQCDTPPKRLEATVMQDCLLVGNGWHPTMVSIVNGKAVEKIDRRDLRRVV